MTRSSFPACAALVLVLLGAPSVPALAQTSTLSAVADTYLRSGSANQNQGSDTILRVQSSGNNRALVRFDSAAIAAAVGSGSLASARLELYIQSNSNNWGTDGRTVDAHRLTASWTESGATWNCAVDSNPGNSSADCAAQWAGGQFADEPSDTVLHTNGLTGWIGFDVTADVRAFLAGTANYGWIVEKTDESQSGQADYTSRQGTAGNGPRLVLTVESATFDQVPPSIAITSPSRSVLVNEPSPAVAVTYADGGSGVDTATLQVLIDAQDVTASCAAGPASASCQLSALAAGNHTLVAKVRDHAGNQAQASFSFQLLLGAGPHLVTFQAVGDTYLRQGSANQNQGTEPIVRIQQSGSNRALVQFDAQSLASTLAGATLVSASLELHVEENGRNWGTTGRTVDTHRLTVAWTETGATWNCANDANLSNSQPDCASQWAGGSFASAPTASVLHTKDLAGWVSFDVTSDVAAFLSGTPNYGWLIKKTNESQAGRMDYDSRQGTAGEGPRLVVVFTTPANGDTTPPAVAITAPANGSFVNTPLLRVTGTVTDDGVVAGVTVNEFPATIAGGVFTVDIPINEGANTLTVRAVDSAGNAALATAGVILDSVVPDLTLTLSPEAGTIVGAAPPQVAITYADGASGLDLTSFQFQLDGAGVSCSPGPQSASCTLPALQNGNHLVKVQIRDRAGNLALSQRPFSFVLDQAAPTVTITAPAAGALLNQSVVRVTGTATDDSGVTSLTINGQPAGVTSGQFSAAVNLEQGSNQVEVLAFDGAGRQGRATVTVSVDSQDPTVVVETPKPEQKVNDALVLVAGTATDTNGVTRVEVGGAPASLSDGQFEREVALQEGNNTVLVRAFDAAGNVGEASVPVERFTLPQVEILSPVDLSYIASATVEVRGSVSDPAAAVKVNGVAAVVSGNTFVAQNVPLIEGGNIVTATATTALGRIGADSINVVRDLTAPHVAVYQPREGAELFAPAVTVSGLVNDIVAGTVNASEATVTVNGRAAAVANRSFVAVGVPLTPGDNVLSVVATDASGNTGHAEVRVRLEPADVPRLSVVSGDGQTGVIGTQLAQPLVAVLLDAAGQPVAGQPVLFKVVSSDGTLDGGRRQVAVTTAADGKAAVHFTLGTRAGVANQMVEATVSRFRGPAVFRAIALAGSPSLIVVDAGNQQLGVAGHALPQPLVATVTDAGFNRLGGIQVLFRVVRGRGQFQNGLQQVTMATDSDGRAIAPFVLPPEEEESSSHVVEAVIAGLEGSPIATFVSYGRTAGEASQTSISGIVVDNSNVPVPGVTLRILDTTITAQTDVKGLFKIQPAPVGTVKLVVDGSTAARPGSWPDLEFVMTTIAGRDNDLGMPIYLLPLDLDHGVVVDETRGGTLTLPDVPGFALEIQPGSVTFPNGSKSGVVSVTAVHSDKVPMVPNFGQQPRLIVTIQPAGARFDPPARLTLPNVEGLAPGKVTEFYSFDHDLGHFVSIGPATVSEDGTVIVSNPGVGILKAGWHCGGDPAAAGTPADCPPCQICDGSQCVQACPRSSSLVAVAMNDLQIVAAAAGQCTCDDHNDCTINDHCDGHGGCTGDPVEVRAINGACVAATNQALSLTADSNAPDRVKWQAPSGNPSSGQGASFSVTYATEGSFVVTAMCAASSKTKNVSTGPSCASITATLQEPEVAGTTADWGEVVPGTRREAKYKGCVDASKWCFRLEEYLEEHSFAINNGAGVTDISGANDAAITPATCQQVIADFTPPPTGTASGPPRTQYWSSTITTAHERFHVQDVHTRITQRVFTDLQAFVSQSGHCTNCQSATPTGTFDAKMNQLFNSYYSALLTNAEQLAHNHSNPMYSALIAQIRQRARNAPAAQHWPAACM